MQFNIGTGSKNQLKPIPRLIKVAKNGIKANPESSMFRINFNLDTRLGETFGSSPLLRGIAHKI